MTTPARKPRYVFGEFVLSPARRVLLQPRLLEKAVAAGLRSLFVGFETLNPLGLRAQGKVQNLHREPEWRARLRHFAYAAGWKKFEPFWFFVIRARRVAQMLPVLETVLGSGDTEPAPQRPPRAEWRAGAAVP